MRLPENFVQEVLDRTDIEELIGRYVTLKRTGSNLVGLCPFHSEKTPSFTVTPSKSMFFCFGCHAGGTAITFVQKAENLEFTDAVAFLADRAGLPKRYLLQAESRPCLKNGRCTQWRGIFSSDKAIFLQEYFVYSKKN